MNPIQSIKAIGAALVITAMTSCAVFQNPTLTSLLVSQAVSLALSHTPEPPRHRVAVDVQYAAGLYNSLINPDGSIATPEQFAAAMIKYIPEGPDKVTAMAMLNPLYKTYYTQIAAKSPKDQAAYLSIILNGMAAGSASY